MGWLKPHQASNQEIQDLLSIVERDLNDSQGDLSLDWKFGITYTPVSDILNFAA